MDKFWTILLSVLGLNSVALFVALLYFGHIALLFFILGSYGYVFLIEKLYGLIERTKRVEVKE